MKVIMFEAEAWCKSCIAMKPFFKQECEKLGVDYEIVDVEDDKGVEMSTEYQIRNVPTLLFLDDNNNVIGRASGSNAYKDIEKYV
jgi:thiol-disulfide isomerase/thioredoxin